jgi:hypothetical protein
MSNRMEVAMSNRVTIEHHPLGKCARCYSITILHARWMCNTCYKVALDSGTVLEYPLMGRGMMLPDADLLWIYNRCRALGKPGTILWPLLGYGSRKHMTGKVWEARKRLARAAS